VCHGIRGNTGDNINNKGGNKYYQHLNNIRQKFQHDRKAIEEKNRVLNSKTKGHNNNPATSSWLRNKNNNEENNNNNRKQQHAPSHSTSRSRARQQRAGRHYARSKATENLQERSNQLDSGREKFRASLKPSNEELLEQANKANIRATGNEGPRFKIAAREIVRREREASATVSAESKKLDAEERYGYFPREKPDDAYRVLFENWNSLGVFTGNDKIDKIDGLVKHYQVDTLAGCEVQCDWRQAERERKFQHLFAFGQRKKCVVGHNTTEKNVRDQRGGTAMATFGRMSACVIDSGADYTGLGRWCWQLVGKGGKQTRIVVAYQPCEKNANSKGFTTCEQQERYFEPRGDFRSPRTIFYEQLVTQLLLWKASGDEIILCGDFNENVYDSRIGRRLAQPDLYMKEQCLLKTGERLPNTFITGTRPIDGVFATSGIEILYAGLLPKYGGVGDHRAFILDFTTASVLGTSFPRVLPHQGRKLNCYCERIRDNYNKVLDQLADRHEMYRKMNDLTRLADLISAAEFQTKINRWDDELTDYMKAAEERCHKYKQNHVEWSPEFGVWKRRQRLLYRVGKYLRGKVKDSRNLIRDCLKKKICDPRLMDQELLKVELFLCKKKMQELKASAPADRHEHLKNRLQVHRESGNEKAIADVLRIMRREANDKRFKRLRWTNKPNQGGAVYDVRIKQGDNTVEVNTEDGIFTHVSEHLSERFRLAFSAPCYRGGLFDDVGFIGDTAAARAILEGTYVYPPDTDPATRLLLEEAAIIYATMPREEIATYVTVEDFQYYWQRANERISSSYSGLHMGHYKAASFDPHLSALHAQKLTLCARTGVPLGRWGVGLTVLLEKICGNNYVNKLRAICLFEADFNWWNKLIFARRMMHSAKHNESVPDELFSTSGSQTMDAIMSKTFFSDVSKVQHHPASIEGCDLGDCYDRGAHPPTSIGMQAWGVPINAIKVLLTSLEMMQFCLKTGFGESKKWFGGSEESKLAGYGQGNGAAPPAFTCLSTLIINAYKRMGNGAKLTSSYAARIFLLAAAMYVDDTDLLHWADSPVTEDEELVEQVQAATNDFAHLAQASGGALKPEKCFVYFLAYHTVRGQTKLKTLSQLPDPVALVEVKQKDGSVKLAPSHISIPQPNGAPVYIPTMDVSEATKMLGVLFAPIGNGIPHIEMMREKGLDWVDKLKTRPLHKRDAWLSLFIQLYPAMAYGLASAVISPKKLDMLIQGVYYKVLPLLGINRCITLAWRLLSERFQGLGLPNFIVDCFAAKIYFMQTTWGFDCASGKLMIHAYEAFMIEVGLYGNIFSYDYDALGCLATDGTWFKNFWEYASHLKVNVELSGDYHYDQVRAGDSSFLQLLIRGGFSDPKILLRLNRMRKYKGIVHVSDTTSCDGRTIEPWVLDKSPKESSSYTFPLERPTRADFALWNDSIRAATSAACILPVGDALGAYISEGHRKMRWYLSEDEEELYYVYEEEFEDRYDVFHRKSRAHNTRYGQQYQWEATCEGIPPKHTYASIREVDDSTVTLHSKIAVARPIQVETDFWAVLHGFENQSLWRNFQCDGDGKWIHQGLLLGTLVIVHDGSYMPLLSKKACSAAFMILDTHTNNRAKGVVAERSDNADNYRAEILGGLMVQLVLRAASQNRASPYAPVRIDCDNDGVVKHGNAPGRKLKEKQAQSDILRCFKQQVEFNPFDSEFHWVASHQDKNKSWCQLTLREKINVIVDRLAGLGLIAGITDGEFISSEFPFEQIRVSTDGHKVTSSLKKALNTFWSYRTAREFFHAKKIVNKYEFHMIWWDGVETAMKSFPILFRNFVTKQTSKFCGTNRQLSRINPSVENVCPSCGRDDESSKHITRCNESGRRQMLEHTVDELATWMASTRVDPHLRTMITRYLLAQDTKTMKECLSGHSSILRTLAEVHDRLGWDNFVEGRISLLFLEAVRPALDGRRSRLTPERWCHTLVTKLLQLTHKQWLFRNSHVNHKKLEGMTTAQHEQIFEKVKSMMWTDPADMLAKHRYLLEEDFQLLGEGTSGERQQWIDSMESALSAADHVRSGKKYWGEPGTFAPTRHARTTVTLKSPSSGSYVYRRSRTGKRSSGGIS